jgi:hypothetical protein
VSRTRVVRTSPIFSGPKNNWAARAFPERNDIYSVIAATDPTKIETDCLSFDFLPVCWVERTNHSDEVGDVAAAAAAVKATAAERAGDGGSRSTTSCCHLRSDRPKSHEMVTCRKGGQNKFEDFINKSSIDFPEYLRSSLTRISLATKPH